MHVRGRGHHAAVLSLSLATLQLPGGGDKLVLSSGACDGQVALWDVSAVLERILTAYVPFDGDDERFAREGSPSSLVGRSSRPPCL
jgi:hypothetical protein